jgi:hypothetical protein
VVDRSRRGSQRADLLEGGKYRRRCRDRAGDTRWSDILVDAFESVEFVSAVVVEGVGDRRGARLDLDDRLLGA